MESREEEGRAKDNQGKVREERGVDHESWGIDCRSILTPCWGLGQGFSQGTGQAHTYVMRMDWFSLSGREKRKGNGVRAEGPGGGWGWGTGWGAGLTRQHVLIGIVGDGEDVGRGLAPLLAPVGSHHISVVHWQPLVGVDSDAEEA